MLCVALFCDYGVGVFGKKTGLFLRGGGVFDLPRVSRI